MADAGQHFRPAIHEAADAFFHTVEGGRGLAHLGCAFRFHWAHRAAHAESLSGGRDFAQRAHLVAHENRGHQEQQQRRAHDPNDKKIDRPAEQALARNFHMQNTIRHLHANDHAARIALPIGIKGQAHTFLHGCRQIFLKRQQGHGSGAPTGCGKLRASFISKGQIKPPGSFAENPGAVLLKRFALQQAHHHGNVTCHARSQAARNHIQVAAIENLQGNRLQQQQRHQNDQQRAAQKPARHQPAQAPA